MRDDYTFVSYNSGADPFRLDNELGERAPHTRKLSTVEITSRVLCHGNEVAAFDYNWVFEPDAAWLESAASILRIPESLTTLPDGCIPYGVSRSVAHVASLPSEKEFVAAIRDCDISLEDLNDVLQNDAYLKGFSYETQQLAGMCRSVAQSFSAFCQVALNYGVPFASLQTAGKSAMWAFVDAYTKLIDYLVGSQKAPMTILNTIAHAFLVVPERIGGVTRSCSDAAIALPYHPAILEKMCARAQFIRESVSKALRSPGLRDLAQVDVIVDRVSSMCVITSGLDVLFGPQAHQYLQPGPVFGYYATYPCLKENNNPISMAGALSGAGDADDDLTRGALKGKRLQVS